MKLNTIKIDVISDVVCPWCYIGKRRLEEAINNWKGSPIEVEYHPFQLNPDIPQNGIDRTTYLQNKFGDLSRVNNMISNIENIGKQVGINYNFEAQKLSINTLPLHTLLHVAGKEGFKTKLKERFLQAYFVEGLKLNELEILYSIMAEFNWSKNRVNEALNDIEMQKEVNSELDYYKSLGVSSVPCFIINNKYSISGAQEVQVFLDVFAKVSQEI